MEIKGLSHLGGKTEYKQDYAPEMLEAFENKHQGNDYWVTFDCPEFTSLCPITGQPDFATIRIDYIPDVKMVESKSLKLYLFSFRNHGAFHEDCINIIMKDLINLMNPKYIEVTGIFTPRGGISIMSRKSSSLIMCHMTSTRKPSTPRSSQNRMASSIACWTSGLRQFRSGCSFRKAW